MPSRVDTAAAPIVYIRAMQQPVFPVVRGGAAAALVVASCALAACSGTAPSASNGGTSGAAAPGSTAVSGSTTASPNRSNRSNPSNPSAQPAGVAVGADVVGPSQPATGPVINTVAQAWKTMTWTLYNHHPVVDAAAGRYQFDCVGMTNYFLSVAAPNANNDLRTAEGIPDHYVPTPDKVLDFIRGLPPAGTATWRPVTALTDIQAGDLLAFGSQGRDVGHAAIAAGPPLALTDGSYALLIYDSTGLVHGPQDTRNWDERAQPGGSHPHTGLGRGTVRLTGTSPQEWSMHWTTTSTRAYGDGVAVARPLS